MSFVYPAGLWALLGLVLLAAICMVRRHSELTPVSSTYLWRLSDQSRKKNRHLRRLKRTLYFLLHFMEIAIAALLIAQPLIAMPGSGVDVAVILDASASMRMADTAGETRFSRAVAAIQSDMAKLPWGASVTVVLANDEAAVAADHVSPGADLRAALENAACGWGKGDLQGALSLCEAMMQEGTISRVCLYTDTQYEQTEGIEVICLRGAEEWNVSLGEMRAEGSIYGTAFETVVVSHGRSADITFELTVDGKVQDESAVLLRVNGQEQASAYCPANEETQVSLLLRQVYDYSDVRLVARAEDGLTADNETRLFKQEETTARVLLVGENAYFWEKALNALPQTELTTAKNLKDAELNGYDIYAFDGCLPDKLPKDGAVWLLNPPRSPREIGVVFGERLMGTYVSRAGGDEALHQSLTQNLALRDVAVARFYEMTAQGGLESALMCGEMPVMAAGRNENGCLLVVMPFDLQESSLPLLPDFVVLAHNMTEASAPTLLDQKIVDAGERILLHPHPLCSKLFLQTPDLHLSTLNPGEASGGIRISAPGGYSLLQEVREEQQVINFFARVPVGERTTELVTRTEPLVLSADSENQESRTVEARIFAPARLLALLLMGLLLVEWGMYHRERY